MIQWPLMKETITLIDKIKMIKFILSTKKFTNGEKVKEFENNWNSWLGSKYSLFVSSGSAANLLLLSSIKELYKLNDNDKVLVPACTWVTNVSPVFQVGFQPIFADINLKNFSFDLEECEKLKDKHPDIKIIFVTHLLGLPAEIDKLKNIFPNALILEDICESHGVEYKKNIKHGSDSLGATFSYYFGHHMTSIEGGIVSTNNKELYELMRLKRSHGMAREASPDYFERYKKEYPDLPPSFLFITDGYNLRNHEIPAVLATSQLKRLDKMIEIRKQNYRKFIDIISSHSDKFFIPENTELNSSFCFPLVCKEKNNLLKLKKLFDENGVEYRPVVSGNLLKHPFLKKYKISTSDKNITLVHENGMYIGNNHFVNDRDLLLLTKILEQL